MFCNPFFLIVGCKTKPKRIDTPERFPPPPKRVLCPHFGNIADAEYKCLKYKCHLCLIPCLPCGSRDPYLSCTACNNELGIMGDQKCSSCEVTSTFGSKNCPICGASKEDGNSGGGDGYKRLDMR